MKKSLTIFMVFIMTSLTQAVTHDVSIINFAFDPADLSVEVGDSVRWTNLDQAPHTATSTTDVWDSGTLNHGESFTYSFAEQGEFPYFCELHPSMTGVINVDFPDTNQGNWEEVFSNLNSPLSDVYFFDSNIGWAAGESGILRTLTGGDLWILFTTPDDVEAVYFVDETEGWAAGNDGMILHTTTGGVDWDPQVSGFDDKIRDIRFLDNQVGWAVGRDGALLSTVNGGQTWVNQANPAVDDLRGIHIVNTNKAWVVGSDGIILKTIDGGENWLEVPSGTNEELEAIFFINNSIGWICGGSGVMLKTTNGGDTWSFQNTNATQNINDVHFVDENTGWAVGDAGVFIKTIDGGDIWVDGVPGILTDWAAVYMVSNDWGFAVGTNGSIIRYSSQTAIDDVTEVKIPSSIELGANYPNPFNNTTTIPFTLNEHSNIRLEIYDIAGRSLGVIYEGAKAAGNHKVSWTADDLASGVYFYNLTGDGVSQTQRMIYLK